MIKKFESHSNGLEDVTDKYWSMKEESSRISITEEEIIRDIFSKYNVCTLNKTTISTSSRNYDIISSNKMYSFKKVTIKKVIRTIESNIRIEKDINDYFFLHYNTTNVDFLLNFNNINPQGDFYNTIEKKIFRIDFPDLEKGFKYFIENYLIKK